MLAKSTKCHKRLTALLMHNPAVEMTVLSPIYTAIKDGRYDTAHTIMTQAAKAGIKAGIKAKVQMYDEAILRKLVRKQRIFGQTQLG